MNDVPPQYVRRGKPPEGKNTDRFCTAEGCVLTIGDHSGHTCSICGDPIEHHLPHVLSFDERCLAGRLRMASARQAAGVELDDVDRLVLQEADL